MTIIAAVNTAKSVFMADHYKRPTHLFLGANQHKEYVALCKWSCRHPITDPLPDDWPYMMSGLKVFEVLYTDFLKVA